MPPAQYLVVIVTKDPHTSAKYEGLITTQEMQATSSKDKQKTKLLDDKRNYSQVDKQEETLEAGKMPLDRFQILSTLQRRRQIRPNRRLLSEQ